MQLAVNRHACCRHLDPAADGVRGDALPVCEPVSPHCGAVHAVSVGDDPMRDLARAVRNVSGVCWQYVYGHDTLCICGERDLLLIQVSAQSMWSTFCTAHVVAAFTGTGQIGIPHV